MRKIQQDYSLLSHNTFGLQANCSYFVEYDSTEELLGLLKDELFRKYPFLHIGSGSNLLFTGNYKGIILHSKIQYITPLEETPEDVLIEVGSGVVWDDFVEYCVSNNFYGVENLSLIPGEVGASAVQNIGAYGVEVKDVIDSVHVVSIKDNSEHVFTNSECKYGYRESVFKKEWKGQYIVTSVTFRLSKTPHFDIQYGNIKTALAHYDDITLRNIREVIIATRNSKLPDPAVMGNAGSFFMNPVIEKAKYESLLIEYPDMPHYNVSEERVKIPAAWLIEKCGWKGKKHGGAGVHDKQCLVLVNTGNATPMDIVELSQAICRSVDERFGVKINPEVNFIG